MSIAEKFEVIADAVYNKGIADRDELIWNMVTDNGKKEHYSASFSRSNWEGYQFVKPIVPKGNIIQMFYSCPNMQALPMPIDYSEIFTLGTDSVGNRRDVFAYCSVLKTIPDLNMRAIGGLEGWFQYDRNLHTIELLRVKRETIYTSTFTACEKLTEIRFDGEIGQDISFPDSTLLSAESQVNIIKHLVDFSGTSDEGTKILSIHPTAFERLNVTYSTPEEVGIPFFGSWISYIESIGWHM